MDTLSLTKEAKIYNGKKNNLFNNWCWGNWSTTCKIMKLEHHSIVFLDFFVLITAAGAKLFQSCLTLCDPADSSPPDSPIPGSLQARILEWVAISFSNAGK